MNSKFLFLKPDPPWNDLSRNPSRLSRYSNAKHKHVSFQRPRKMTCFVNVMCCDIPSAIAFINRVIAGHPPAPGLPTWPNLTWHLHVMMAAEFGFIIFLIIDPTSFASGTEYRSEHALFCGTSWKIVEHCADAQTRRCADATMTKMTQINWMIIIRIMMSFVKLWRLTIRSKPDANLRLFIDSGPD